MVKVLVYRLKGGYEDYEGWKARPVQVESGKVRVVLLVEVLWCSRPV